MTWLEAQMLVPMPGDILHVRNRTAVGSRIRSVVKSNHDHDATVCRNRDGALCAYNERWPHSHLDNLQDYLMKVIRDGGEWVITRPKWVVDIEVYGTGPDVDIPAWRREHDLICIRREGNYYPFKNIVAVYAKHRKWARWMRRAITPNDKAHFCSASVRWVLLDNSVYPWSPDHVLLEPLAAPIHWARAYRDGHMKMIAHYGALGSSLGLVQ